MITREEIENMFATELRREIYFLSPAEIGPNDIPQKSLQVKRYWITRIERHFDNSLLVFWHRDRAGEESIHAASDCDLFCSFDACIEELKRRIVRIYA